MDLLPFVHMSLDWVWGQGLGGRGLASWERRGPPLPLCSAMPTENWTRYPPHHFDSLDPRRVMEITFEVARLRAKPLTEPPRRGENFSPGTLTPSSASATLCDDTAATLRNPMRQNARPVLALAGFKRVISVIKYQEFMPDPSDHQIPFSHGEGRYVASSAVMTELIKNGQVAFQYCDAQGVPSHRIEFNPNGSVQAVEGITSPCGRVLGKMGHSERRGSQVAKNIPGNKFQGLFEGGVDYFS